MKQHRKPQPVVVVLLLSLLFFATACEGNGATAISNAPKEILLGASIPKSGALAAFGLYEEWGYTTAINDLNRTGGLYLAQYHTKVPVRLITYNNQSDGKLAASDANRLITQDKVIALLGSATPPLVIPSAQVAEKMHIPYIAGLMPIRAFLGGAPKVNGVQQWNYAWDVFFDEVNMTEQQFLAMDTQKSNRKVALFTDNEQDGLVMGSLWEKFAVKYGYDVVLHAKFPVGTTDYTNFITQAKAVDADIVITQMILPDTVTLWQQFRQQGYHPKAAFLEKAAEGAELTSVLRTAAQGIMLEGFWYPTLPYPGAAALRQHFEIDTGQTYAPQIATAYSVTQVLMDAIEHAGNLNAQDINTAIGKTKKTYVVGPVNFSSGPGKNTSLVPNFIIQWQNGQTQIVYPPKLATAKMLYPLP